MAVGAVTGREHGLVDSRCPVCGTLVAASAGRGRPRVYCSDRCRWKRGHQRARAVTWLSDEELIAALRSLFRALEPGKGGSEQVALGDTRCKPRRLGVPPTPRSRRGGPRSPLCAARRAEAGYTGARVGRAAQTRQRRSQDPALRPRRGGAAGRRAGVALDGWYPLERSVAAGRAGAASLAAVQLPGRAAGAVQLATPSRGGLDRAGRVRGRGRHDQGARVCWPVRWPIGRAEV